MKKLKSLVFTVALVSLISLGCISTAYGVSFSSMKKKSDGIAKLGKFTAQDLIVRRQYEQARGILNESNVNILDSAGNTALHCAAEMDNGELVEHLLSIGADSMIRNKCGDAAIHIAVNNKCVHAAEILAKIGSDVFEKDGEGVRAIDIALEKGGAIMRAVINETTSRASDSDANTILHYIARAGNEAALDYYIAKKLPLSAVNSEGKTPLALAWEQAERFSAVRVGAKLVLAGSDLVRGNLSYFEDALKRGDMMLRSGAGQTPLYIAATQGHTGVVAYIVKETPANSLNGTLSAILSVRGKNGETPLHKAVQGGNLDVVRLLLESGADANAADSHGRTSALLPVSGSDRYDIYELLVKHGANLKRTDSDGNGVFHVASENSYERKLLEFFLLNGAKPNDRNNHGVTPLSIAVGQKNSDHALFYIKNGADIHSYDDSEDSPLTKALADSSDEMTRTLVTRAFLDARDKYGNSPLEVAVIRQAKVEYINYLISIGADVNARNNDGETPLFFALLKNENDVCDLLLSHGANIFAADKWNNSPLRFAFVKGEDILARLISSKSINSGDENKNTPLHLAAAWKNDFAVRYLLEKGAKIAQKNIFGETALFSAVKSDCVPVMELLLENGAEFDNKKSGYDNHMNTILHAAVLANSFEAAKKSVSLGVDVNARNDENMTALDCVCRKNDIKMARFLIENGADVGIADSEGRTLLMKAVIDGNEELVGLLLESNADISVADASGKTAYHYAAQFSSPKIIMLLRNAGANPLAKDSSGNTPFLLSLLRDNDISLSVLGEDSGISGENAETPFHIAIRNRLNALYLDMLAKKGFPLDNANDAGETPLKLAVSSGLRAQALFLLSKGANPFSEAADGECAVSSAIKSGNIQIIDGMVKYSAAKTNAKKEGILHYAARYADEETVRHILSLGTLKKSVKNSSGETPEKLAAKLNRPEIAKLLK